MRRRASRDSARACAGRVVAKQVDVELGNRRHVYVLIVLSEGRRCRNSVPRTR